MRLPEHACLVAFAAAVKQLGDVVDRIVFEAVTSEIARMCRRLKLLALISREHDLRIDPEFLPNVGEHLGVG